MQRNRSSKEDKAMMLDVALVQQMAAYSMNINSKKETREILRDKLEKPLNSLGQYNSVEDIKAYLVKLELNENHAKDLAPKILEIKNNKQLNFAQKKEQFYNLAVNSGENISACYPKLSVENNQLEAYEPDAERFTLMLKEFFDNLPSDPENAWKVIHYCSMKLYAECETIDDTISYIETSSKVQKIALFVNYIKDHIENILSSSNDKDKFKFWSNVYLYAKNDKDAPMINSIDAAFKNSTIANKLSKYKLDEDIEIFRNEHAKLFRNDANYIIGTFKPTPALASMFGSTLELAIDAKLEVAVHAKKSLKKAQEIYENMIKNPGIKHDFDDVIKSLPAIIDANLSVPYDDNFINEKCIPQKNNLVNLGYDETTAINILTVFLEAIKAVNLHKNPEFKNENASIDGQLNKQIENKTNEIKNLNNQRVNLANSHTEFREKTINEINKIFKNEPLLQSIHEIGLINETTKKAKTLQTLSIQFPNLAEVAPKILYSNSSIKKHKLISRSDAIGQSSTESLSKSHDSEPMNQPFKQSNKSQAAILNRSFALGSAKLSSTSSTDETSKNNTTIPTLETKQKSTTTITQNDLITESHKEILLLIDEINTGKSTIENYQSLTKLAGEILARRDPTEINLRRPLTIFYGAVQKEEYAIADRQLDEIKAMLMQLNPTLSSSQPRNSSTATLQMNIKQNSENNESGTENNIPNLTSNDPVSAPLARTRSRFNTSSRKGQLLNKEELNQAFDQQVNSQNQSTISVRNK